MEKMHSLLRRQLRRHYGPEDSAPKELEKLLDAVNKAYFDSDTDRKMLERALELSSIELLQANAELQAIIKGFPDVFMRINQEGTILVYKSNESGDAFPWSESLQNKRFCEIFGKAAQNKLEQAFKEVRDNHNMRSIEASWDAGDDLRYYEIRLQPMDEKQIYAIIRDITERKLAEEQLVYYSLFDPLTNLYNRAYFEKEMHRFQNQCNEPVGLIVCDVDNLKLVNDTYGHDSGDELLMEVARVLRQSHRKQDVIARIGGDEFAILLPDCDESALESTCQRIYRNIQDYNNKLPRIPLGISLGYSIRNIAERKMIDVFKEADDKMYREKFRHHRRFNKDMVATVLEALDENKLVIAARLQKYDEARAELNLQIGYGEFEDALHTSELLFQVNRVSKDGEKLWMLAPAISRIAGDEFVKNNLNALIVLLNAVLNSEDLKQPNDQ